MSHRPIKLMRHPLYFSYIIFSEENTLPRFSRRDTIYKRFQAMIGPKNQPLLSIVFLPLNLLYYIALTPSGHTCIANPANNKFRLTTMGGVFGVGLLLDIAFLMFDFKRKNGNFTLLDRGIYRNLLLLYYCNKISQFSNL